MAEIKDFDFVGTLDDVGVDFYTGEFIVSIRIRTEKNVLNEMIPSKGIAIKVIK